MWLIISIIITIVSYYFLYKVPIEKGDVESVKWKLAMFLLMTVPYLNILILIIGIVLFTIVILDDADIHEYKFFQKIFNIKEKSDE